MNPMMMQTNPAMAPTGGVRPPLVQGNATQATMRPINPAMMGMTPAVSSLFFLNFLDDEYNDDESDGDVAAKNANAECIDDKAKSSKQSYSRLEELSCRINLIIY